MKKETLEEAAQKHAENKSSAVEWLIEQLNQSIGLTKFVDNCDEDYKSEILGIINQAKKMEKQQAERMYSEEEVLQLLLRLQQTESYDNLYDWFKQFKKK